MSTLRAETLRAGNAATNRALAAGWVPPVDIAEHADRFVLSVDIPGVDPDSIEISMKDRILTLSGERPNTGSARCKRLTERQSGPFHRQFTLPATVDSDRIVARSQHGAVHVVIPKQAEIKARRIAVAAG